MQIDAAVESVLLSVESHRVLLQVMVRSVAGYSQRTRADEAMMVIQSLHPTAAAWLGRREAMPDISSLLLGKRLEQVAKDDPAWAFSFSGGLILRVECLWRLIVSGRVAITGEDHGQQFGLPAPVDCVSELQRRVEGVPVTSVKVRARTVDISLHFGDVATLEVIATSAGYEAWVLSGPDVIMVGQPGYE